MEQNATESPVKAERKRFTFDALLNEHRKTVTYVLGGVLAIIVGYIAFQSFYLQPMEKDAQRDIIGAQRNYDIDSFKQALNGGQGFKGFLAVASEYGWTKTGKLAHYYAGTILMKDGKYEQAIEHLKSFNSDSKIHGPMSLGLIGDAYSQLKNYDEAASYYMKAAKADDNTFTAPRYYKKAGLAYEELKKFQDAVNAYQIIKDKFPTSAEGNKIETWINRAQAGLDK